MTILLSLLALACTVVAVILTSEHSRRCGQIEHIKSNVKITPKVSKSLETLNRLRRLMRNAGRWFSIVAIYGGFPLAAYFWAESITNLMHLTLGSAIVAVIAVLFIESRSTRHREFIPGAAAS